MLEQLFSAYEIFDCDSESVTIDKVITLDGEKWDVVVIHYLEAWVDFYRFYEDDRASKRMSLKVKLS